MAIMFQKRFRRMKKIDSSSSSMSVLQEGNRVKTSLLTPIQKKKARGLVE
jgi:hypothetical protein